VSQPSAAEARRIERRLEEASRPMRRARLAVTRRTGLTTSGLLVAGLAVCAWILAYTVGGRPLFLVSYGSLAVLGLAWLLSNRPMDLTGSRSTARPRVGQGETIDVVVKLEGTRRFATFFLEEQVPSALGESPRVAVPAFEPGAEVDHTYQLTFWRRGAYQVGPLTARWSDPFNLIERRKVLAEPHEVLVHPSVETVQDRPLTRLWEDPPIRPPISKPWPTGMEFYGMRTYARGDDPRRIVWRAFARTGQVLVRESEQGITDKLTILLDNDRRTHSKGHISESFEAGVHVAASVADRHLREGYSVTLETNDGRLAGPLRTAHARLGLLDQLARVDLSTPSLSDAVLRLAFDTTRDAYMVLITPLLDSSAAARVRLLLDRGVSVLVAALVWNEDAVDTLASAAALGAQVIEIGPNTPLEVAFRHEVGGGR
jgi:uncharacterized protein (DUF58 family)